MTLDDLGRMKADALLVNVSRAELITPGALEQALDAGRPGFAALDVFEQEPLLNPDHPLLRNPRVLCTPHLGYVEKTAMNCTSAMRSTTCWPIAPEPRPRWPTPKHWVTRSRR